MGRVRRDKNTLRVNAASAVCALFLSFSFLWGRQLDRNGGVDFLSLQTWLWPLVMAACLLPGIRWLFSRSPRCRQPAALAGRGGFWCRAGILFLSWFLVFLAAYPGFFSYDATDELEEVLTGSYVTRHPLVHVLLLGKTVQGIRRLTGSYNTGIAVYVLVQMALTALLLSWILGLIGRVCSKKWLAAALFFFAFFPVIPMYALCTSKDLPYTACMLAAVALLWQGASGYGASVSGKRMGYGIALTLSLFGMAVFRSNGLYVFLLTVPVVLGLAGKRGRKRAAFVCLAALLLCLGTKGFLRTLLRPADTDAQEAFTVPIQQLARTWTYSPEIFGETGQQDLFAFLPRETLARYTPKLSDPVKIDFRTEKYREDPARFWRLWLSVGGRAPFTYGNAWLMTSYGFWYPFTVIDVYNGSRYYETCSYFSCETEPPGVRQSRFPFLEAVYKSISWRDKIHRIPVVSWLFSPGFLCWIYVTGGLYLAARGRWRDLGAFAPVYLNLLSVLFGPTCLVRYVLIFWFALPLFLVVIRSQICYTAMDNGESGKACRLGALQERLS